MKRLLVLGILTLLACDRNDSDDEFPPPETPPPTLPVAVAGDDFEALTSASGVALSGSKSRDPLGGVLSYQWSQVGGIPVTLSDATVAAPTFIAPAAAGALTFQLKVTNAQGSSVDEVTVNVKTLIVTAPDAWFVGYEKTGGVTATVAGGTGPFTYEWTGVEPWLAVSGAATDILTYTTPKFTALQNFPARAEVAVMERTTQGRLQLKVTVTDSTGAVDEDLVNFSAGPFADSVANENVALGEPVFLNGATTTVTAWQWTGTKPNGAAISFFRPDKAGLAAATDQRFVYFVPDLVGPYEIILTQNPGPTQVVKVINITSGKYVGVGNLTGAPPDPFKGECASCHGGQLSWLADFAGPWKETGHAHMLERILDPVNPFYAPSQAKGHWKDGFNFGSNYSIDSRTVGWSAITAWANDGWVQRASVDGYVFKDSTWHELVVKHPKTAALSNVQCESCHGPGSEHAGDTTGIRKSYDSALCGRCHARKQDLWEASSHGKPPLSPSGSASCNGCHTAQGYVVEMRAQEGAEPHSALFAVSNVNRPVIPFEDRRGTTCQACHEPHKKTAKRTGTGVDPQLRAYGNVMFRNGATVNAGAAATCFTCHQSRTDTRAGSGDMNIRRAPHDSTMAEMLSGTNGIHVAGWTYNVSPHGIASRFVSPGRNENRQCLACHNDVQPPKGAIGYNAIGGHTFNMKQGTGTSIATQASHAGAATIGGTKKFTVTSGSSFLKSIFTGDQLTVTTATADTGTYTVSDVDASNQVTLSAPADFAGASVTGWSLTSTMKYNASACTQCHTTALDFRVVARGDYDGDAVLEAVQDEIAGLRSALSAAVNARLAAWVGSGTTFTAASGRIKYNKLGSGTLRTFPGPSVTASDNPDIAWTSLSSAQQTEWSSLYQAAYNHTFVGNDKSQGIHNTGYAVNLLQSSYRSVTGASIGSPFVSFP